MPRDGSNIYHTPPGTPGVTNTTIASTPYNGYLADIEQDLNLPRPIVAGGTGANNAIDALNNLGGEISTQNVTNYSSFTFQPGSFVSTGTATGSPVAGHRFEGICYGTVGTNLMLEARDVSVGTFTKYIRNYDGATWGAWQLDGSSQFVSKTGDTMTGDLTISEAGPDLILNKASGTSGTQNNLWGMTNNVPRWVIQIGNELAESSTSTGSDFIIQRYSNAGAFIDNPLTIPRSTGNLIAGGAVASVTGTYYFTSAGNKSLIWDGATFNFNGGPVAITAGALAATGNISSNGAVLAAGGLWAADSSTIGTVFFGSPGSKSLQWDGTSYNFNGGPVIVNSGTLTVNNNVIATGYRSRSGISGAYSGNNFNHYYNGSVAQLWMDTTNLGTIAFSSDYRIKKDVIDLPGMWDTVKKLRPIKYTQAEFLMFTADNVERWGFIAHELQETLVPSASSGIKDAPNEIQSPNPFAIIAALTKALQEAMSRIEALEAKA